MTSNTKNGGFRLMVQVGSTWVPAHTGTRTRAAARLLKRMYASERPANATRVVSATETSAEV